jgi:hypothetical protein
MKDTLRRGTMIVGTALLFAGTGCGPDPKPGEACGEPACDSNDIELVCVDGQWSSQNYPCDCFEPSTTRRYDCPAAGFVGIAQAKRERTQGRRLRRVRKRLPGLVTA